MQGNIRKRRQLKTPLHLLRCALVPDRHPIPGWFERSHKIADINVLMATYALNRESAAFNEFADGFANRQRLREWNRLGIFLLCTANHRLKIKTGLFSGGSRPMLRIVLFHAWLNLKYPSSATPLAPLIARLLEEKRSANAELPTSYEGLYRVAFGPGVSPFTRK